jgi:hypothetical protein
MIGDIEANSGVVGIWALWSLRAAQERIQVWRKIVLPVASVALAVLLAWSLSNSIPEDHVDRSG